jgi:hypothetical protein
MSEGDLEARRKLTEIVGTSLQKAEGVVANLRKTHNRVVVTTIFSSGAATLIAGITAAVGPSAGIGTEGWRTACILAAIFGFLSTASSGLSQQMKYTDRLSEGKQCVGELRYLNVVIGTGSKDLDEITRKYEEVVKNYSEYI